MVNGTFTAKKLHLKIVESYLICFLIVEIHKYTIEHVNFINFLRAIFEYKMSCYPHFLYYCCALKGFSPTFTTFHQMIPLLAHFYHHLSLLIDFYYLPPTFSNCYITFVCSHQFGDTSYIITHSVNITIHFKLVSSGNLSSVSIKILVSSSFSVPIISLILYHTLSIIWSFYDH